LSAIILGEWNGISELWVSTCKLNFKYKVVSGLEKDMIIVTVTFQSTLRKFLDGVLLYWNWVNVVNKSILATIQLCKIQHQYLATILKLKNHPIYLIWDIPKNKYKLQREMLTHSLSHDQRKSTARGDLVLIVYFKIYKISLER